VTDWIWRGVWLGSVLLSGGLVVWGWVLWFNCRATFPPSKVRSWTEFIALILGTLSALLYFPFVLGVMYLFLHEGAFSITETTQRAWIYAGWGTAGAGLVVSLFGNGKVRIAEMLIGIAMFFLWWVIWNIDQIHLPNRVF
jgi:hypothetical protein